MIAAAGGARGAFVTGAGGGIGRAIARRLAAGGDVVAVADVDGAGAERTVAGIIETGGAALAVEVDVRDEESVTAAIDGFAAEQGNLQVLVNNAGVLLPGASVEEQPLVGWETLLSVNLTGAFLCAKAAAPHLRRSGAGRIVNVISRAWLGAAGLVAYASSKGGLVSLTRSLALELGSDGVTVNAVSPGAIATPMHDALPPAARREVEARARQLPVPRMGRPDDVAAAIAFLASEAAGYVTGQNLYVSGGAELRTSS